MIEKLKTLISESKIEEALLMIETNPPILNEKDAQGTSGFLLIAYAQNKPLFEAAIKLKNHFSFYEAIIAGKENIVSESLLAERALIDKFSPDGFTPIALATFFNHNQIVKLFLEKGADPAICASNPLNVNALHAAVAQNNLQICQMLTNHGIDVNISQMKKITPLHASVHRGNLEITRLLLEHGAQVTFKNDDGNDALDIAKAEGHQNMLDLLNTFK